MADGQPTHDDGSAASRLHALEQALALAERELRSARRLDTLARSAGAIAHDLNNLLMVVNFQAERVEQDLGPAHEAARELVAAAEKAAALVDRLLALRAQEQLDVAQVDLNACARRVLDALGARIPEGVTLRWELDAALGRTLADPGHLERIVHQLVLNALDAMPAGGTLTLATRHVRAEDAAHDPDAPGRGAWVLLELRDSGEGMDEDTRKRAFEPFVTTRLGDGHDGLGLAAVAALVRQWHGSVHLHSQPGRGTTVRVFLPRGRDEDVHAPVVLVVDREPAVRRLVHDSLAGRGYEVVEAPDARAALQVADRRDARVDLLLVDALVAERDAADLGERLGRRSPALAIITMTSDLYGRAGTTLRKPFTVSSLLAAVEGALHGSAARA